MIIHYSTNLNPDIAKISAACRNAEVILAVQIMKDTRPYVPALTMSLNNRTHVVGNTIIYPGPYARYLYVGKRMVNASTGKGPMYIPGVGYRWKKGTKLVPTDKPLHYTTTVHAKAGAMWMERSLKDNKEKWKNVGRKAVAEYGR